MTVKKQTVRPSLQGLWVLILAAIALLTVPLLSITLSKISIHVPAGAVPENKEPSSFVGIASTATQEPTLNPTGTNAPTLIPPATFTQVPPDPFVGWDVISGLPVDSSKPSFRTLVMIKHDCRIVWFKDDNGVSRAYSIPLCNQYNLDASDPRFKLMIQTVNNAYAYKGKAPLPNPTDAWINKHLEQVESRYYILVSLESWRMSGTAYLTTGNKDYLNMYTGHDVSIQPPVEGYLNGLRRVYKLGDKTLYALETFQHGVVIAGPVAYIYTYQISADLAQEQWKDIHYVYEEKGKIYVLDFPSTFGTYTWSQYPSLGQGKSIRDEAYPQQVFELQK